MTNQQQPPSAEGPSRRERLRPLELIGFSAVLAIFAGLVVLLVLRTDEGIPNFTMAAIAAGIVFIVTILMVALVTLGGKPSEADIEARKDLKSPDADDRPNWH